MTGLISVCLDCKVSGRGDLSPRLFSFWFIHSNGEVSFPSCVGAQDRRMGGRSRGLNPQSNSWVILLFFFFLTFCSHLFCELWSNRCASSYLAGANNTSRELYFSSKAYSTSWRNFWCDIVSNYLEPFQFSFEPLLIQFPDKKYKGNIFFYITYPAVFCHPDIVVKEHWGARIKERLIISWQDKAQFWLTLDNRDPFSTVISKPYSQKQAI